MTEQQDALAAARRAAVDRPASQGDGTHPRPMLVREHHLALDRAVRFAHDDALVGLDEHWESDPDRFDRWIQLPFPPESDASGVRARDYHPCVWYRMVLSPEDLVAAGHSRGRRLLLHFGAVDYQATVWVDGVPVGTHEGGQTSFTFDVTTALSEELPEHIVVVRALDDPFDSHMPRGKQDWLPEPHLIWYHRTTGIWRTVWLESVPALHVARVAWRTDISRNLVSVTIELNVRPSGPVELAVALANAGRPLVTSMVTADDQVLSVTLDLSGPNGGARFGELLWSPERPTLLDAGIALADDVVSSYCGMREVAVTPDGLRINGHRFYLRSVLEQGYWPASHLAAPSVTAFGDEVRLILELGFNSARVHQKVEDPRFHFWADKLGLTLWGETAATYMFDSLAVQRLSREWVDIVRDYESHPSIIAWVPLNESWGVLGILRDPSQQAYARALADLTRALDPTRPVVSNDGWEHVNSDLLTIHDYEFRRGVLAERYASGGIDHLRSAVGPDHTLVVPGCEDAHAAAPVFLTEFGGIHFAPAGEGGWGYSSASDPADLERRIADILEPVKESEVLAGFCWTQLTDTLQEANGLCDENRVPKVPVEVLKRLIGSLS